MDVECCETEPDRALRVNALGSQNLAIAAERAGAGYLYFSSDYVFDGRSSCDYDELTPPCPVNQYGRSKLAGEVLARRICRRTYVVRTAWLIGHRKGNYVERVLDMADRDGAVGGIVTWLAAIIAGMDADPTLRSDVAALLAARVGAGLDGPPEGFTAEPGRRVLQDC